MITMFQTSDNNVILTNKTTT